MFVFKAVDYAVDYCDNGGICMNNFNIVYKQCGKYSAIVYSDSYINPIDDIQAISMELKKHLSAGCYVLFDLLLSNGDNFNRFAEVYYDGGDINIGMVNITSISSEYLHILNLYYRGKTNELKRSVLSSKDKYRFATMK